MARPGCDTLEVVQPETSVNSENCPVLGKMAAFVVEQGRRATLEWVLKTRDGLAIDLTLCRDQLDSVTSEESEQATGATARGRVIVRVAEALDACPSSELYETEATVVANNPATVRVTLDSRIVQRAGIYLVEFGAFNELGHLLAVNKTLLSVERSLFVAAQDRRYAPPTLQEIRLHLRDSATENSLTEAVEFDAAEVIRAIVHPVEEFNEMLPVLPERYTTRNFPFRSLWLKAIKGYLFLMAADHLRRNQRTYQAEGLNWSDSDKPPAYERAAQQLLAEWRQEAQQHRVVMASRYAYGMIGSDYGYVG
jgi:hypothetical protein